MYGRIISRHNKNGTPISYVKLAHNFRDPKSGYARARVLYTFGRADSLEKVIIRGRIMALTSVQTRLYEKFKKIMQERMSRKK